MGKQGPCCHCGVTSTPLWRNGPPEKPVLCNACGSRWRTKGSLANYTPLHSRFDPDDYEGYKVTKVKTISLKRKDEKLGKRKLNYDEKIDEDYTPDYSHGFRKNLNEDASNRSSSGSAVSNSESCVQFGYGDASELTGPEQSVVWEAMVPSRKRTFITRPKQSSVEKLTKDLHTILHEQASHFSGSSEEDLIFESETPMGSVEFGHGSVLIRHPCSMARDEESEASSLSIDNKLCRVDEGYVNPASLVSLDYSKSAYNSCLGIGKVKKLNGQSMLVEQAKSNKSTHEKLLGLWNHNSSLLQTDLTEIINMDVFLGHLTTDEQKVLYNYLPSVDTSKNFNSLKSMFACPIFTENLSSFQHLLEEGILDSSLPGINNEDYKILKRFAFYDLTKSKWVELYSMIKDKTMKESTGECIGLSGSKSSSSGDVIIAKKSREGKTILKTPESVLIEGEHECKDSLHGSCFIPCPHNLFALQAKGSSLMLNSFEFGDQSSDQDILLDIPWNGSFPEAELLHPASSFAT